MNIPSKYPRYITFGLLALLVSGCANLAASPTATPLPPTKTYTPLPTKTNTPKPPTKTNTPLPPTATYTVTPTFTVTSTSTPSVILGDWEGGAPDFWISFKTSIRDGVIILNFNEIYWEITCGGGAFYYLTFDDLMGHAIEVENNSFEATIKNVKISGKFSTPETVEGTFYQYKSTLICETGIDWKASPVGLTSTP